MASRLYPATVGLFCPVLKVLGLWGLGQQMSARCVQLVCLYVWGLIAAVRDGASRARGAEAFAGQAEGDFEANCVTLGQIARRCRRKALGIFS